MNENVEVYFRIEEWIPAENAISGKGMYYPLHDGQIKDESVAIVLVNKLRGQGRNVRMVKVTEEVVLFARGREIADPQPDQFPNLPDCSADPVFFTDGSAVACLSQWRGPYSRYTPDVDAESPQWWIGEPA